MVESSVANNAQVSIAPFFPSSPEVTFTISHLDSAKAGNATIIAVDGVGNKCSVDVVFPANNSPLRCDVDQDADVDRDDISAIFAARNRPATSATDVRDNDGDGTITVNDGRQCQNQCTLARCISP